MANAKHLELLVLDDVEDDAVLAARELQRHGYDVSWTRVDTRAGMAAALDQNEWDLIVSDFIMPTFSAPEALALYHDRGLDIPFIILSGTVSEDQAIESLTAGAHDFITKSKVARLVPAIERTLRDLHKRRDAEEARAQAAERLRESEARYRRVIESIQDVIFAGSVDPSEPLNVRVAFISPQAEAMTGCPAQEFLENPKLWPSLVAPDDRVALHDVTATAFRDRTSVRRRYRLWHRTRQEHRWIEDTFTPEVAESGKVVGFFGVARDVTDQRRVEEQLRQAQKVDSVGHLAGGIAHDFNNLLGVLMGYSELLLRDLPPDHAGHRRSREMRDIVERAAALPRQLLAFTRGQSLEQRPLSLNAVVTDTERMLRRVIGENIQLVTVLDETVGPVRADAGQISQVIVNLAINARDAMPQGGRLVIETMPMKLDGPDARWPEAPAGPYSVLSVSDSGIGMDDNTLAQAFEPLFTTKEPGKGTGLGLSNVRSIVTLHGGHILVESQAGTGTTLTILFPQTQWTPPTPVAPKTGPQLPRGSEKILLLEDEATLRVVMRELLEAAGYRVLEADIPEAALAVVDDSFDLLVTDIVMPRMTGRDVAAAIRRTHPRVRVLYMSGYHGDALAADDATNTEPHYLEKPFTSQALLSAVREVLDESG